MTTPERQALAERKIRETIGSNPERLREQAARFRNGAASLFTPEVQALEADHSVRVQYAAIADTYIKMAEAYEVAATTIERLLPGGVT